jgi:hypothetical protein
MATDAKRTAKKQRRDPWRSVYRFTAEQAFEMVEHGILPEGGHIELWDGVFYHMTRGELHNLITGQVANALRSVMPAGYHVREEKSCSFGEHSLPEPDVAICRGDARAYYPKPPNLARLALVVEVDHTTTKPERNKRLRRYAEVGIPVYWQVGATDRRVTVYRLPGGSGAGASYSASESYGSNESVPINIDGTEVGRANVADFFPLEP